MTAQSRDRFSPACVAADPILEVRNLSVHYGSVEAVRDVGLTVHAGTIVSIIGANGAGKSTFLNAVMGLLPAVGDIRVEGASIRHRSIEDRVAGGLVLIPERRELFGEMTVEENLLLGAFTHPSGRHEALEKIFDRFARLRERRAQRSDTLSGGERQMVAIGRALMSRPRILMLDEPSLGLAPLIVRDILKVVTELRDEGVTILLVEQNARAALAISDVAHVMEHGRFILSGTGAELVADPAVERIYLGGAG